MENYYDNSMDQSYKIKLVAFQKNQSDRLIFNSFVGLDYNQDFELSLDDNLRLKTDTFVISDTIEKNKSEQAF